MYELGQRPGGASRRNPGGGASRLLPKVCVSVLAGKDRPCRHRLRVPGVGAGWLPPIVEVAIHIYGGDDHGSACPGDCVSRVCRRTGPVSTPFGPSWDRKGDPRAAARQVIRRDGRRPWLRGRLALRDEPVGPVLPAAVRTHDSVIQKTAKLGGFSGAAPRLWGERGSPARSPSYRRSHWGGFSQRS